MRATLAASSPKASVSMQSREPEMAGSSDEQTMRATCALPEREAASRRVSAELRSVEGVRRAASSWTATLSQLCTMTRTSK